MSEDPKTIEILSSVRRDTPADVLRMLWNYLVTSAGWYGGSNHLWACRGEGCNEPNAYRDCTGYAVGFFRYVSFSRQ